MNEPENTTPKNYASVADMLKGEGLDKEAAEERQDLEERTQLVRALERFRLEAGLTQKELADKMGVSQSTISKIEMKHDDELLLNTIAEYVTHCGFSLNLRIGPTPTLAQCINGSAQSLQCGLSKMKELAEKNDDTAIARGIDELLTETGFRLTNILTQFIETQQSNEAAQSQSRVTIEATNVGVARKGGRTQTRTVAKYSTETHPQEPVPTRSHVRLSPPRRRKGPLDISRDSGPGSRR